MIIYLKLMTFITHRPINTGLDPKREKIIRKKTNLMTAGETMNLIVITGWWRPWGSKMLEGFGGGKCSNKAKIGRFLNVFQTILQHILIYFVLYLMSVLMGATQLAMYIAPALNIQVSSSIKIDVFPRNF